MVMGMLMMTFVKVMMAGMAKDKRAKDQEATKHSIHAKHT
jgi:hypothetical protein